MPRFSLIQLFMATALVAILLLVVRTEGCGSGYTLVESISFSSDGSRLVVARLDARDANVSMKLYKADLARTISWIDTKSGESLGIVQQDYRAGNYGPAFQYFCVGRTSAVCNPRDNSVVATEFGGGGVSIYSNPEAVPSPVVSIPMIDPKLNLAVSQTGRFIAASSDNEVTLLDGSTHSVLWNHRLSNLSFIGGPMLSFSPDETQLATNVGSDIQIWDTGTGKLMASLNVGNQRQNESFALAPELTIVAVHPVNGRNRTQRIDASGNVRTSFKGLGTHLLCQLAGDNQIAFLRLGSITFCDLDSGSLIKNVICSDAHTMSISPDGRFIAVGQRGSTLSLIDVDSGQVLWSISPPGHYRWPWTVPVGFLIAWAIAAWWLAKRAKWRNATALA